MKYGKSGSHGTIELYRCISAGYAITSTLSGNKGLVSLSPAVGNVMLEKFQDIGWSEGLNLKDSNKMDSTTSVKLLGRVV